MAGSTPPPRRVRPVAVAIWFGVGACVVYGAFALDAASNVVLSLLGLVEDTPSRSSPPLFVVHALSGGIALIAGPLQLALAPRSLARAPRLHRALGRVYVGAAWVTSAAGLATAVAFDVGPAGTLAFALWALLWFATTTAALTAVRKGLIAQHRGWMVRSVALSLVFAAFSVVQPVLVGAGLPRDVAYPLAVLGSVAVVLAGAEIGVRARLTTVPAADLGTRRQRADPDVVCEEGASTST
jgi:uncharacterized membrane protein